MDDLFSNNEYSFEPNFTEKMNSDEAIEFLKNEAQIEIDNNEYEIAYCIYREIIQRDELPSSQIWYNLAKCAKLLGKIDEYNEALKRSGMNES